MTLGIFQFQPHIVSTATILVLIPVFIYLGVWQLERAEQKRTLASTLDARRDLPPMLLSSDLPDREELQFRNLVAEGVYETDKTILIENRKHAGKTGFHVVTPLYVPSMEKYLLINRGWVQAGPKLSVPVFSTPEGMQRISGEIAIPLAPALNLNKVQVASSESNRWPFLTLERYADWSKLPIYPFWVLRSADEDESGFVRKWPKQKANDAMHIGYAIQWFAFALIVFGIWLKLSLHRQETGEVQE